MIVEQCPQAVYAVRPTIVLPAIVDAQGVPAVETSRSQLAGLPGPDASDGIDLSAFAQRCPVDQPAVLGVALEIASRGNDQIKRNADP